MLFPMPNPLQMVIDLRMQLLPIFARKAKNRVIAAHPALDQIMQVEGIFRFPTQVLNDLAFADFAFQRFVEADEGGCAEEVADHGFPAGFEEAGEGDDGLGAFDGWGFIAVGGFGGHGGVLVVSWDVVGV